MRAEHADGMFGVLSDARIHTFLPSAPPASAEVLRARYAFLAEGRSPDGAERWLNWILVTREDTRPVGLWQATVRPSHTSVAYLLDPRRWGQGLASEAGRAVLSHLFSTLGLAWLQAEVHPDNLASVALLRALRFQRERHDADEGDDIYVLRAENR